MKSLALMPALCALALATLANAEVASSIANPAIDMQGFLAIGCVCSEKESVRREIREFLEGMKARHIGISDSITAALGNVNLYTLFGESPPDSAAEVCSPYEF